MESARRASAIHKLRTGRSLRITEYHVLNDEMYEEEDDALPIRQLRLNAHLANSNAEFSRRLGEYVSTQQAGRAARQAESENQQAASHITSPAYGPEHNASPTMFMPPTPMATPHIMPRTMQFTHPGALNLYQLSPVQPNGLQMQPSFLPTLSIPGLPSHNPGSLDDQQLLNHIWMFPANQGSNTTVQNNGAFFYGTDPVTMPNSFNTAMGGLSTNSNHTGLPSGFNAAMGALTTDDNYISSPTTYNNSSSSSSMTPPTPPHASAFAPRIVQGESSAMGAERAQRAQANQLREAQRELEETAGLGSPEWTDFADEEDDEFSPDWDQQEILS